MRIGPYENSHNRNKTRIDTRPQSDPAVAAGLRNIRRDTSGQVVGGITPEGQRIGTANRSWSTSPMGPGGGMRPAVAGGGSLGRPATPGLDRLAAMQSSGPPTDFGVANEKRKRKELAATGAFGKGPQNLAQRQQLFADMKSAGSGAASPDIAKRAAGLGVTRSQYDRAWSKVPQAPASIAAAKPTTPAGSMVMRPQSAMPAMATAPTGKALAEANIAKMGVAGAAADYFKRSDAEKQQKRQRSWNQVASMPQAKPMSPASGSRRTFESVAGLPEKSKPVAATVPTMDFSVPPVANPISIGGTPPPAPPPAPPTAAKPQPKKRAWMEPTGASFTYPEARKPDMSSQRIREANERLKKRRAAASSFTDNAPTWRNTYFGDIMNWLSKPML
jgi:hypothetical protein